MKKISSILIVALFFQGITVSYAAGSDASVSISINEGSVVPSASTTIDTVTNTPVLAKSSHKRIKILAVCLTGIGLLAIAGGAIAYSNGSFQEYFGSGTSAGETSEGGDPLFINQQSTG